MTTKRRKVTVERLTALCADIEALGLNLHVQDDKTVNIGMSIAQLRGYPPDPETHYTLSQPLQIEGPLSDEDIVELILHGILCAVMHETQEQFFFRGETVANPHTVGPLYPTSYTTRGLIRF